MCKIAVVEPLTSRICREYQFIPASVCLAPEDRSPFLVECFYGCVLVPEPFFKCSETITAVAVCGIVAAEFIVDLPGYDIRVVSVISGYFSYNPQGFLPVCPIVMAVLAPASVSPCSSVGVLHIYVRVFIHKPLWRRCGRCPQHHLNTFAGQYCDSFIQPYEIILSPPGF